MTFQTIAPISDDDLEILIGTAKGDLAVPAEYALALVARLKIAEADVEEITITSNQNCAALADAQFALADARACNVALIKALENAITIAEDYGQPGRFRVHECWANDLSPAEVYDTAAIDVGGFIAKEIRAALALVETGQPA